MQWCRNISVVVECSPSQDHDIAILVVPQTEQCKPQYKLQISNESVITIISYNHVVFIPISRHFLKLFVLIPWWIKIIHRFNIKAIFYLKFTKNVTWIHNHSRTLILIGYSYLTVTNRMECHFTFRWNRITLLQITIKCNRFSFFHTPQKC